MKLRTILIILLLSAYERGFAADTVRIVTSAQCESCKNRIETRLHKVKGIFNSNLDIDSKVLVVEYDRSKISPQEIELKVTEIGYDANGKEAKKAAYKRLPACCRKDYKGTH